MAQTALLHALSHKMCPADSIKLLCKHAVGPDENRGSQTEPGGMDEALHFALSNCAAEPIIRILLNYGASPNAEPYTLPLITAINSEASEDVVIVLLQHGADPNLRPQSGAPMTPLECAKQRDRRDMIALFTGHGIVSNLPDLTPSRSTGSRTAEASLRRAQSSRYQASITVLDGLNDVDGADELDDLGEDVVDKLKTQSMNDPTDAVGSSRLWFSGIPSFPLSRFRRNSKQK